MPSKLKFRPPQPRDLLLLLGAVLIGFTAFLLGSELGEPEAPPQSGGAVSVESADAYQPRKECYTEAFPTAEAYLAISLGSFDPNTETLTLTPRLCFPPRLFQELHLVHSGLGAPSRNSVVPPGETFSLRIDADKLAAGVSLDPVDPGGATNEGAELEPEFHGTPLGHLYLTNGREPGPISLTPYALPLAATPQHYPLDWYATSDVIDVGAPEGSEPTFAYCPNGHEVSVYTCGFGVPTRVTVYAEPSLSQFHLQANLARSNRVVDQFLLTIKLARKTAIKLYVLFIALIPLIFGVLLMVMLVQRRSEPVGAEGIAAVAAVLLAILPIRLVLVPAEVHTLTVVDYVLGLEMAILAAIACFSVWLALGRRHPPD